MNEIPTNKPSSIFTKNVIIFVLIAGLLVLGYFYYSNDKGYKEEIKKIEKKRDSLQMNLAVLKYRNDSLANLEPEIRYRYLKTEKKLKQQENETDAIPGIVATYSDRKLDSILTNFRFKPRAKSRDSISP